MTLGEWKGTESKVFCFQKSPPPPSIEQPSVAFLSTLKQVISKTNEFFSQKKKEYLKQLW